MKDRKIIGIERRIKHCKYRIDNCIYGIKNAPTIRGRNIFRLGFIESVQKLKSLYKEKCFLKYSISTASQLYTSKTSNNTTQSQRNETDK